MPDHHPAILSAHFPQAAPHAWTSHLRDLLMGGGASHAVPRTPAQGSIRALTWLLLLRDHSHTQTGREGSFTLKSLAACRLTVLRDREPMAVALFLFLRAEMIDLSSERQPLPGGTISLGHLPFCHNATSSKWCLGIPFPWLVGLLTVIPWRGGWCHDHPGQSPWRDRSGRVPGSVAAAVTCLPMVFPLDRQRGRAKGKGGYRGLTEGLRQQEKLVAREGGVADPCSCQALARPQGSGHLARTAAQLPAGVSDLLVFFLSRAGVHHNSAALNSTPLIPA